MFCKCLSTPVRTKKEKHTAVPLYTRCFPQCEMRRSAYSSRSPRIGESGTAAEQDGAEQDGAEQDGAEHAAGVCRSRAACLAAACALRGLAH